MIAALVKFNLLCSYICVPGGACECSAYPSLLSHLSSTLTAVCVKYEIHDDLSMAYPCTTFPNPRAKTIWRTDCAHGSPTLNPRYYRNVLALPPENRGTLATCSRCKLES
ncbi:unnamed protein product [Ectocarpus sp. 12 AP-2014]